MAGSEGVTTNAPSEPEAKARSVGNNRKELRSHPAHNRRHIRKRFADVASYRVESLEYPSERSYQDAAQNMGQVGDRSFIMDFYNDGVKRRSQFAGSNSGKKRSQQGAQNLAQSGEGDQQAAQNLQQGKRRSNQEAAQNLVQSGDGGDQSAAQSLTQGAKRSQQGAQNLAQTGEGDQSAAQSLTQGARRSQQGAQNLAQSGEGDQSAAQSLTQGARRSLKQVRRRANPEAAQN